MDPSLALFIVALTAITVVPIAVLVIGRAQLAALQETHRHMAQTERIGEPKDIYELRIQLEREKLQHQQAIQREMLVRRNVHDVNN